MAVDIAIRAIVIDAGIVLGGVVTGFVDNVGHCRCRISLVSRFFFPGWGSWLNTLPRAGARSGPGPGVTPGRGRKRGIARPSDHQSRSARAKDERECRSIVRGYWTGYTCWSEISLERRWSNGGGMSLAG